MEAIKFADPDAGLIRGLAIPYGGPMNGQDLDGEHFGPSTDLCEDWFPSGERPLLYNHGLDPKIKAAVVGRVRSHERDNEGVWVEAQLEKSSHYFDAIKKLIDKGVLFFSSGSVPHLAQANKSTGLIERWPWVELTLTPSPCNLYAALDVPTVKSHFKSAGIEANFDAIEEEIDALTDGDPDPEGIKAKMSAADRDALSDSDFAYIDSSGKRSLPINDEAHVRAAMSRWNQTSFESDSAKAAAKRKIIARAKKLGIEVGDFASSKAADDAMIDALADGTPDAPATKSIEGSYEDLIEDLTALLNPQSPFGPQGYSCIVATFPDHVIVSRYDYGGDADDGQTYWSVQYSVGDDGEPTLGVAAQVEQTYVPAKSYLSDSPLSLDATILGRHAGALAQRTKDLHQRRIAEGRVLSTSNRNSLADAVKTLGSSQSEIKSLIDASDQLGRDQAEASARLRPDARQRRLAALSLCIDEERQTA